MPYTHRSRGLRLVLFFALIVGLVCVPGDSTANEITLDFWYFSSEEKTMQSLLERFEKEHPGVRVKSQLLDWEHGLEKIVLSLVSKSQPDVCELGSDMTSQFIHAGVVEDLTEEFRPIEDQYVMWEWTKSGDRLYGAPWFVGTRVLFYNKKLFRDAGLDPEKPPQTWEELKNCADKIRALGADIHGFGVPVSEEYNPWHMFMALAWGHGAEVRAGRNDIQVDGPRMRESLEFYKTLRPSALVAGMEQLGTAFFADRLGMFISGAWNFRIIDRVNPALEYGVALVPRPGRGGETDTHASFAGGEAFIAFKGGRHKKEAAELIKFLIAEDKVMELVVKQRNILPATKTAEALPFFQENPRQLTFYKQMKTAVNPPTHSEWSKLQKYLSRAVERVMLEDADPAVALAEAKASMAPILERASKVEHSPLDDGKIATAILLLTVLLVVGCLVYYTRFAPALDGPILAKSPSTWLFLSPWLVLFLVFGLYPLVYSFVLSFLRYDLLTGKSALIGLTNYIEVFHDPEFYNALIHTMFFAIGTIPFTMTFALLAAVLIDHPRLPGKGIFRAGLFLPSVTSVIVVASIFNIIYDKDGVLDQILKKLDIAPPDPSWLFNTDRLFEGAILGEISIPLLSIMAMAVWSSFGYYTLLFVAGLQTIPKELYEAAEMDGAGETDKFLHITLPNLKPMILFAVVINTIRSLQVFPEIFAMTRGGPLGRTTTVVYQVYDTAFRKFEMGYASALGYVLLVIIIIFTYMQMKFMRVEEGTSR